MNRHDSYMVINTVYARHGKIFKTASIQEYFESQSWYEPVSSDSHDIVGDFNEFEMCYENADMLNTFEDSTGVIMPTQENALWWLYNYLFVKKKRE